MDGEQLELFANGEVQMFRSASNPMIAAFGEGPEGAKCRTCAHFGCKQYANRYYKCGLRGTTGGKGRSQLLLACMWKVRTRDIEGIGEYRIPLLYPLIRLPFH